jgi:hypothetical protein
VLHNLIAVFQKSAGNFPNPAEEIASAASAPAEPEGTSIYTWHDGKPQYDEVSWLPEPITRDQAYEMALNKLKVDRRATRVRVSLDGASAVEAMRHVRQKAG